MFVFLGGTCNNSRWRDKIIPLLTVGWYNPMKENWTQEMYETEVRLRGLAGIVLYTITPKMTGVYSVAEVVSDSHVQPEATVLCILTDDDGEKFDDFRYRSLIASAAIVTRNGGALFFSLESAAQFINGLEEKFNG